MPCDVSLACSLCVATALAHPMLNMAHDPELANMCLESKFVPPLRVSQTDKVTKLTTT